MSNVNTYLRLGDIVIDSPIWIATTYTRTPLHIYYYNTMQGNL